MRKRSEPKRPVGRPRTRPKWQPKYAADLDPAEVYRLCLIGCTVETIAARLETTPDVLNASFIHELNLARAERKEKLLAAQWELAVEKGDKTMLIWLGKQDLGQTDRQESTAEYKTFEVIIGEPIPNNRIPTAPGAIAVLEE